MRFAHLADIHLGYEQYNLPWRAEDFSKAFRDVVEKCKDVDFVLIAGDLFHRSSPNPKTLKDAVEILWTFKDREVPVFAIEGNHDRSGREVSAYHLLEKLDLLNLLGFRRDRIESEYVSSEKVDGVYLAKGFYKDFEIVGCGYIRWKTDKYLKFLKTSSNRSILMLHQAVKELSDDTSFEITLDDLPEAKYYAMGHIHDFKKIKVDGSYLVYPGSIERCDSKEATIFIEYDENLIVREGAKKGFVLVENFEPTFLEIDTRRLVNLKISAKKYSEIEEKLTDVLKLLKSDDVVIVKFLSEEELNVKKVSQLLSTVKHYEIRFEKIKKVLEYKSVPKEDEFFTDFETKILEVLKDYDDLSRRTAVELIRSYFGISDKKLLDEKEEKKVEKREEVKKKVKRTLFDFLGD